MTDRAPIIVWVRRDLRLSDHAAFAAAAATGRPVIPVFVRDALVNKLGAAPKWRLRLGLALFQSQLTDIGSRLTFRSGNALDALERVLEETGARSVYWLRAYDPESVARDTDVKEVLKERGIEVQSFTGHLLFEPWTVQNKTGGFYKVYTPFWKAVRDRDVATPTEAPLRFPPPVRWPATESLTDWGMGDAMKRGARIVRPYVRLGEALAQERLGRFTDMMVSQYDTYRDVPSVDGTSGLSENLALGEISPAQCWHAGMQALQDGKAGAETFLKELVWREFAYHLMWHTPRILTDNWRPEWDAFPWRTNPDHPHVMAWQRGLTGIRFVDAAMREMYVTGRMHNRGRMIVASYLTKHLMTDWRIGRDWFEDCLIDWDPASNAMGWQWSAGSGPDATPYFRVFNPVTQRDKFDPQRKYVRRWIAEGQSEPGEDALAYFDAVPRSWGMSPDADYPEPIISAEEGRKVALKAYENKGF